MAREKTEAEKLQYYKQVGERSFKTVFDQYLFYRFSRGEQENISKEDFMLFSPEQSIINEYVNEYWQKDYKYQKEGKWQYNIKQIETFIYKWEKESDTEKTTTECETYYVGIRFKEIYPFQQFVELLENKTCYYCGISEEEIAVLISKHEIYKKKTTRGWTLEIDRKKPNLEYKHDNCVRCCYWCNSAKTDEFDELEFAPIGEAIKSIWDARLSR